MGASGFRLALSVYHDDLCTKFSHSGDRSPSVWGRQSDGARPCAPEGEQRTFTRVSQLAHDFATEVSEILNSNFP